MIINMVSDLTGNVGSMDINVTQAQLSDWYDGVLIQDAMPHLTPEEREFIKTGITPKEWDEMFGDNNGGD
jgi:hypothetical protein